MGNEMDGNESLNRVLRQWEPPAPSAALDDRVFSSFRRETSKSRRLDWRFWLTLAAVIAAAIWIPRMHRAPGLELDSLLDGASGSYITRVNASGFQPAAEPEITVTGRQP